MYRSRRSQGGNKGHLILDHKNNVATLKKEIKVKINNMKYKIKVSGIVNFSNEEGEAQMVQFKIRVKPFKNGTIKVICEGHKGHKIRKWTRRSLTSFISSGHWRSYHSEYQGVIDEVEFKDLSKTWFYIVEPKPYPAIIVKVMFPCGNVYYLRISWKRGYEFWLSESIPSEFISSVKMPSKWFRI